MTTTAELHAEAAAIADRRRDVIQMPTLDDRAAGLLRMAEERLLDRAQPAARDLGRCEELIVRSLASRALSDVVMTRFDGLVDAVREQQRYDSDPTGYADTHDWPTNDRALDSLSDRLAGNVDAATWDLLSPAPACRICQRTGGRASWKPADWPASSYCTDHRPASAESVSR